MAYQPLDTTKNEIRLLKIDTTIPVLRCTLTHHSLSANAPSPTYSALSYAWGPVGDTHDIVVNGCPTLATHSLYTALLQLGDDSPGYLWVDALCINQRDIAEKTSQIQRMGEIYSGAEQVVAWLGPATLNSQNAFCLIERLWREIFDPMYTAEEKAGQSLGNQEWVKYCRAMGQLCQLPYWRRTWIIQEIALARGLVFRCGQLRCVGTHLFNALDVSPFGTFGTERTENWTDVVNGEEYEAMETVRGLMRFTKEWGSGRKPLLECLFLAAHMRSEASDPRDRVYGMLGIATDGLELVPSPGYEAQNTLQAMLKNLTTSYINTKGGLDIILCRNREEISKEETPSWVPDYTSFSKSVPRHLTGILTNSRSFNCTPGLHNSEKENYRLDGNLLNAKVLLWDTVANIGATREIYEKEPYFVDIAKSLANKNLPTPNDELVQAQLTSPKNPYTSGSNAYQAILTTIIRDQQQNIDRRLMGGALKNLWNKPEEFHRCLLDVNATYTVADTMNWLAQNSSFKVCGRSLQEWTEEEEKEEDDGIPENKKVALMRYVQNIIASTFYARRRLVTTEKGYIGNAHGSARVGDKVALMAGCSVPVLLRQEGGQTGFEVVGDVYVSSIMWGEKYANILGMAEWESVEIH